MKKDFFLKEEVISIFEKDGVVVLRNVVNKNWRKILINSIENEINEPGPYHHFYKSDNCKGKFHGSMRIWEHNEGFKKYCLKSPLPHFAAQLLNSKKINLFYDQLFVKEKYSNLFGWLINKSLLILFDY